MNITDELDTAQRLHDDAAHYMPGRPEMAFALAATALGHLATAAAIGQEGKEDDALDDLARDMLELEGQRFKYAGNKRKAEADVLQGHGIDSDQFGVRYAQILNQVLETASAAAHAPALVERLRRKRAS